jgi:hypothetical protein
MSDTVYRDLNYVLTGSGVKLVRAYELDPQFVLEAVQATTRLFDELHRVSPHVFALLGMRNLSAFVGAAFIEELSKATSRTLILNPHQDGYPDLLLMDKPGRAMWVAIADAQIRDKGPFSPFPGGGLEVKATCGAVPTGAVLAKRGLQKPAIGDQRIQLITGIDWKAHHRETNYLMGLIWDFVGGLPAITAVTYRNDLSEEDWGNIISPRSGGGRTTSVSIMTKAGVAKMCSNTILALEGPYLALAKRFAESRVKSRSGDRPPS